RDGEDRSRALHGHGCGRAGAIRCLCELLPNRHRYRVRGTDRPGRRSPRRGVGAAIRHRRRHRVDARTRPRVHRSDREHGDPPPGGGHHADAGPRAERAASRPADLPHGPHRRTRAGTKLLDERRHDRHETTWRYAAMTLDGTPATASMPAVSSRRMAEITAAVAPMMA